MLRRYAFTAFALLTSVLLIIVLFANDELEGSAFGRGFISVAHFLFIPLYVIQTFLVVIVIWLRGGPPTSPDHPLIGVSLGVLEWVLSIVPFFLVDKWRAGWRRRG